MAEPVVTLVSGPSNVELEAFVVAALAGPEAEAARVAVGPVDPEYFTAESGFREVYVAYRGLLEAGLPVNIHAIEDRIFDGKAPDETSLAAGALTRLARTDPPSAEEAVGYSKILREKWQRRSLSDLGRKIVARAMSGAEPAAETAALYAHQIINAIVPESDPAESAYDTIKTHEGGIQAFLSPGAGQKGVPSGLTDLDFLIGGFAPGGLYIVGARTSVGKTSFALSAARNMLRKGASVLMFSLEMDRVSILRRLICSVADVGYSTMMTGVDDGSGEMRALAKALGVVSTWKLYIDQTPGIEVLEAQARVDRAMVAKGPFDLIIVDYLQLMTAKTARRENRVQEVSEITRQLKQIARTHGVPVLALAQLKREADSSRSKKHSRPILPDLRESGEIEQTADVVMFLYRKIMEDQTKVEHEGKAEVIVAKQRNGPTGTAKLHFRGETMSFENLNHGDKEDWDF